MKKLIQTLLSALLVLALTACSSPAPAETGGAAASPASAPAISETAEASPQAEEQRVVALSVAIVEILDALDVPMVGVPTSSYALPDSVKDATAVGNPMSPDLEVIKSLDPTMVFSVIALEPTLKGEFDAVNIPASFVNLSSFDGLAESIHTIGEATGKTRQAQALVQEMEQRVDAVSSAAEGKDAPTVMLIFGASGSFQIGTENSYVGDLIRRAGGINIITDVAASFIPVDMEYLANANPDYILLMTHANPEESKAAFEKEFSENAAWNNFSAVQNDNVIVLETAYFGMSANLLAPDALEKLEAIFYGAS